MKLLNEMNKVKPVLPKPSVNRLIQHRIAEKDFVNKLNIRTTRYASIESKSDMEPLGDFLPGILKQLQWVMMVKANTLLKN